MKELLCILLRVISLVIFIISILVAATGILFVIVGVACVFVGIAALILSPPPVTLPVVGVCVVLFFVFEICGVGLILLGYFGFLLSTLFAFLAQVVCESK